MLKEKLINEIKDKIKNKDLLSASQLSYKLSRVNPNLYELWMLQGIIFYQLGKIDLAITFFKESIHIKKNLETYYFLGICYLDKNLLNELTVLKNDMKKNFNEKDYCKIINKIESIASEH